MRALVLDGTGSDEILGSMAEASRKAGFEMDTVPLAKSPVNGCQGCFACWVKTPGECAFDDGGKAVASKWVGSDLAVFVSPAVFGTYGPALKRAMERLLPVMMPYFKRINGRVGHPHRYAKRPGLLVFGIGAQESENQNFRDMVDRNALTLNPSFHEVVFLDGDGDNEKIAAAFERARKVMA